MRFPFVSRDTHDQLLAAERARAVAAEYQWADLQRKYDALVDRVVNPPIPHAPVRIKDAVAEAVRTRAGSNGALRAILGNYARTCRAESLDDDAIIASVLHWKSSDDDGVE